eukprot:gene25148-33668_t
MVEHGIADSSIAEKPPIICPDFGQPGWGPFCFLNGNPIFNAFDTFQAFVQSSVVQLHDLLQAAGIENAYGPSIILFTLLVRTLLFPVNYQQIASTQKTQALSPKIQEIREKYANNKDLQNQMTALLYEETKVNPLAGCLPAILQIPVFLALYRSFLSLAQQNKLEESFLWLPNLQGPVYNGARNIDWLTVGWHDNIPPLGWHDTLAFLTIPLFLYVAQAISLQVLTPPSDDPTVQQTQRILKYLPLLLAYFSLSVPAGLGVYWITNNIISTTTTAGIKAYFKKNPVSLGIVDIDALASGMNSAYLIPSWGYSSEQQMVDEAKANWRPARKSKIPADFV